MLLAKDFLAQFHPLPKSLSQIERGTLQDFPAPLSCLGEGLGVRVKKHERLHRLADPQQAANSAL